jgi:hypothetical protein
MIFNMSWSNGVEQDPDRVFTEAYWGDISVEPHRLSTTSISYRQKKAMSLLVASLVPGIVSGEITGQVLIAGRFNPTDRDLSRTSAVNMPGTVLISDSERLRPLSSFNSDELKRSWRAGYGDPRDQMSSTRHLLLLRRLFTGPEGRRVDYSKGRVIYSDDTHEYERVVSINVLIPNRRGTATPRDLLICNLPAPDTEGGSTVMLSTSTTLTRDAQIGETYFHTRDDGYGRVTDMGLRRLTSLEICMQGVPAEARDTVFSRALGHLASSAT